MDAVWLDDETFMAITGDGIIRYNVHTRVKEELVALDEINPREITYYPKLSPDGNFAFMPVISRLPAFADNGGTRIMIRDLREFHD